MSSDLVDRSAPGRLAFSRVARPEALALADRFVPVLAVVLALALYAVAYHFHPNRPTPGIPHSGWFGWFDDAKYLRAALAWSHLDLSAAEHWYPAGYPILGAIGLALTPVRPFYLPDALALAASDWLFAAIAAELLRRPGARALGALAFLATACVNGTALSVWVIPYTTTPATVAIYACLLAALRFMARPRPSTCLAAGLCGGGIALFRPTEAALTLGVAGLAMAWTMLRRRVPLSRFALTAGAGLCGAAVPAAIFLATEWATGGFAPGGYLSISALFGFEWRLIPLHWVELFEDPRPLWPGGHGMVLVFPWILPGVAGMAAALAGCRRETRAGHALLIGAVVLHCAVFLAYRDMHPNQLWWIFLYHYFKWVLPVLGLYAALLPAWLLGRRRVPALAAALAAVLALFPWRAELRVLPAGAQQAVRLDDHRLRLPDGLPSVHDAVLLPAEGNFDTVFEGVHVLEAAGRRFRTPFDFRAFLRPGGLMLIPVRPLPAASSVVSFAPGVTLDADVAPVMARQRVVYGVPCWIRSSRPACNPEPVLPGPVLRAGQAIRPQDAAATAFLPAGWGNPEPAGRWTIGPDATVAMRVPDSGGRDFVLEVEASGYASARHPAPSRVQVLARGTQVADWQPGTANGVLRARIPAGLFGPDGRMWLRLRIDAPHSPAEEGGSTDGRKLGLFVRSVRLVPAPPTQAPLAAR